MIVQNVSNDARTTVISFTVPRNEMADAIEAVTPVVEELGGEIGAAG